MKKATNYINSLPADFTSAVVIFLVALPLCLGIALGSGAPLFSGIIGGIVGGVVIGFLSGSHLSVSGPAAGLTAIVALAIGKLGVYEAFLCAVVVCGVLQIIFGFLKAGVLGDYVPGSVIKGMLAAIGLILILKQIPHFVGFEGDYEGDEAFAQKDGKNTFSELYYSMRHILPTAIIIGLISIGIQLFWDKVLVKKAGVFKLIPAPLVVVLAGIGINAYLQANHPDLALGASHLVNIPVAQTFSEFTTFLSLPDFNYLKDSRIWTTGLTLAIVASLETLLNIEAADAVDPYKRVTPSNRELKAQGVGNLVSGMLGGLPLTSVIVRTSANVNAGGKTKMATIMHGGFLFLCVSFIPGWLNMIPFASLAAILIYTGYKLTKVAIFKDFYRKGYEQFLPFVITIVAIIFTDLLIGILIGCCVGLFFLLRSNFKSAILVVNDDDKYLFRLRKDVSFLNKPIIKRKLEEVPQDSFVLIDAGRADFIDRDVVEVIEDFMKHAHLKDIKVELKKNVYKEHGFSDFIPVTVLPKK